MKNIITATRTYREKLLSDPYRPTYHFAIPDDNGYPGDSNGAFYADGRYHLMYLYNNSKTEGYHWGHISSMDLLHWRNHPDALTVEDGDSGCFSGGAFVDDDGTAYLTFWKFPSKDHAADHGGIAMASAKPPYETWERMTPIAIESNKTPWGVVDIEVNGIIEHVSCADPSNIWKANGWYYVQTGNKCVLDNWGRGDDADPHYKGDWTDLFRSKDLKNWEFVHRFYINEHLGADWPDETEDDMCPSFLPLFDAKENGKPTDKWLQLFLSHNKGCQYYVGSFENETFIPEVHGRMTWKDAAYFAPEALIDDKNRHIIWTWLLDCVNIQSFEQSGWSGIYGFPRIVWWKNNVLHMAPAQELDKLQYRHQTPQIERNGSIAVRNGELFRLQATIDMSAQEKSGFRVRTTGDGNAYTEIYYDKPAGKLVMDVTKSGIVRWKTKEEAPFVLADNELLFLDIFVDKSVIEVYANERQAICRTILPEDPSEAVGVCYIGDKTFVRKLDVWEIAPTNPY